jgi:hypothetical protein
VLIRKNPFPDEHYLYEWLAKMPLFSSGATLFANPVEDGRKKRCTHIREALQMPPHTPFFEYNPWRSLAIAWFILVGAEVGRHSNSNIDFVYLFLSFLLNPARPTTLKSSFRRLSASISHLF